MHKRHLLNQILYDAVPLSLILWLILLSLVPMRLPHYAAIAPMLTVIGVGYWSIARPDLIRPSFTFCAGVFEDLLNGTPLGLNALVLLCVNRVSTSQKRFFFAKSFISLWLAFAIIALIAVLLKWLIFALFMSTTSHLSEVLVCYFMTVLFYPAFGRLFASLEALLTRNG